MQTLKMYLAAKNSYHSIDNQRSFIDYLVGALTVKVTPEQMASCIDTANRLMDRQIMGDVSR